MYQGIIDKLESEKIVHKVILPDRVVSLNVDKSPTVEPTPIKKIVAESKPLVHKEDFKDKIKRLQSAANKVRKPILVETIKKKRTVVELW